MFFLRKRSAILLSAIVLVFFTVLGSYDVGQKLLAYMQKNDQEQSRVVVPSSSYTYFAEELDAKSYQEVLKEFSSSKDVHYCLVSYGSISPAKECEEYLKSRKVKF